MNINLAKYKVAILVLLIIHLASIFTIKIFAGYNVTMSQLVINLAITDYWETFSSDEKILFFYSAINFLLSIILGIVMLMLKEERAFRTLYISLFLIFTVSYAFILGAYTNKIGLLNALSGFFSLGFICNLLTVIIASRVKIFTKEGTCIA